MRHPTAHTRRPSLQWLRCGPWLPAMALEAPKQNPWNMAARLFGGPLLRNVLAAAGAEMAIAPD